MSNQGLKCRVFNPGINLAAPHLGGNQTGFTKHGKVVAEGARGAGHSAAGLLDGDGAPRITAKALARLGVVEGASTTPNALEHGPPRGVTQRRKRRDGIHAPMIIR